MPNFTAVIHEIVPRLAFSTPQTPMGKGNGNGKGREEKGMVADSLYFIGRIHLTKDTLACHTRNFLAYFCNSMSKILTVILLSKTMHCEI